MSRKLVAVVVSTLEVALYLASVVVTGIVVGAVSRAIAQFGDEGEITADGIARDILSVTPADALLAWILVDVVVVLLHLDDLADSLGGRAVSGRARPGLGLVILLVLGLQVGFLALAHWTGLDFGWLVIPRAGGEEFLSGAELPVELIVLAVLLHPLATEAFFRASLIRRLDGAGWRPVAVIIIPAVLYALVQPSWGLAVIAFIFGLAVGSIYHQKRSLLQAIVAHVFLLVGGVFAWLLVPAAGITDLALAIYVVLAALVTGLAAWMLWPKDLERPESAVAQA